MTPDEGFKLQIGELIARTERRLWDDKRHFRWFKERFGFSVR